MIVPIGAQTWGANGPTAVWLRSLGPLVGSINIYIYIHTLHYITLHCITLHGITLHYTPLHYITVHYIHAFFFAGLLQAGVLVFGHVRFAVNLDQQFRSIAAIPSSPTTASTLSPLFGILRIAPYDPAHRHSRQTPCRPPTGGAIQRVAGWIDFLWDALLGHQSFMGKLTKFQTVLVSLGFWHRGSMLKAFLLKASRWQKRNSESQTRCQRVRSRWRQWNFVQEWPVGSCLEALFQGMLDRFESRTAHLNLSDLQFPALR